MRHQNREQEIVIEKNSSSEKPAPQLEQKDIEAIKKSLQDADNRYRRLYRKNYRNKYEKKKAGWLTKSLAFVYLLALMVFAGNVTTLAVLPINNNWIAVSAIVVMSVLIAIGLCASNVNKWLRTIAALICICMIAVYSLGSLYIIRTMDFLNSTTEESEKKVESLAYEPFNVMITGIDVSGTIEEKGRSDVNMLVTVNPTTAQILITSIPRDYLIYMPDKEYGVDKLTHTGFYGVDTTIGAEEDLLQTTINYYIKVNFTTVVKFIDAIGGVDVHSDYSFSPLNNPSWAVQEGTNHMNGEQALAFARDRKSFSSGDNQRIKNQQEVVEAVIKKATSSRAMLLKYSEIISVLKDYFKMSISSEEIKQLIRMQIAEKPDWEIIKISLSGEGDMMTTYTSPAEELYVMTRDMKSVEEARMFIRGVLRGGIIVKSDSGSLSMELPEKSNN